MKERAGWRENPTGDGEGDDSEKRPLVVIRRIIDPGMSASGVTVDGEMATETAPAA